MERNIRYRGHTFTAEEIEEIRRLIARHPTASRRALSRKLCEAWHWVQPNGCLRDMVARGLLAFLERQGEIELPPRRASPPNNVIRRKKPPPLPLSWSPVEGSVADLRPLQFRQVRRSAEEALFESFIEAYHYLGYTRPVGEHLKYLIYGRGVPLACMAWSSAPRHIGCRDRYIGWTAEVRRRKIHLLAYNTRFLVLPWVKVPCLASHILSQMARRISSDWQEVYGHPIVFLETFVDPARFRGTCYRAANWILLGVTRGLGKAARTKEPTRSIKEVWGYPLVRDFRRRLCDR